MAHDIWAAAAARNGGADVGAAAVGDDGRAATGAKTCREGGEE